MLFFLQLQQLTGVRLYENESVIIFDEVQLLPKDRQAIKYLVADGRYKYIETGSLLSIKKNTKDILIPSEEHKSLDVFCEKHSSRIRDKYVVHTKDYKWEDGIHYLPVYMVPFL